MPSKILNIGEKQAEEAFVYWKKTLGNNFYAELNRHGLEEENVVNSVLLELCEKHDVKYIAANNTFYTNKAQSEAQDILLCVKDAKNVSQTKKYMGRKSREERFGLPNNEFYFKSQDEMKALFADLPDAIRNVDSLVSEFERYELAREILLPAFDIPDPEILIRTGNTHRLSNFLLWQLAYTELFFESKLWPDFNEKDYAKIINKYKKTKRNFGNI